MATIAAIIAAIDDAILAWAGKPVRLKGPDGREVEYRSLTELISARNAYAQLQATASNGFQGRLT